MDFYETQKKYRNKKIKFISSFIIKFCLIIVVFVFGWRFGVSENEFLILENERLSNKFVVLENDLEKKLISTKIKLKEANHALSIKNIREGSNHGFESKKVLSSALAQGIPEQKVIYHLRALTSKKKCQQFDKKELPVSTETFTPPNSTLILLGGSIRLKAEGKSKNRTIDKPFFDPANPVSITIMYFGGKEIFVKKLPIKKEIIANRLSVNLELTQSTIRGSVIVKYKVCRS